RWGDRFAKRVLGPQELEVFHRRLQRHQRQGVHYLAKRFAAKEAFSKAMGLGLRSPMLMPRLEVLNDRSGKPYAKAHGDLAAWLDTRGIKAHVSISDEQDAAIAFVILETMEPMQ
ncbi:MAG: holo-ACP synthase, partial [Burkholderiaceae bacterium]